MAENKITELFVAESDTIGWFKLESL